MKRFLCLLLCLTLCLSCACSLGEATATEEEEEVITYRTIRSYDSDTLKVTIDQFKTCGARCYLTRIWMQDPGKQIVKATAGWEKDLACPSDIAKTLDCDPVVVINGSGYVSPVFPWIPDNYPGDNADYYYTPLGSLTITNGEIFRDLQVPYYGLTLQQDGLHMHVGEDTSDVLAQDPSQTWSFYVECPVIQDGKSILDPDWKFTNRKAIRTVICKVDDNDYAILTVTAKLSAGMTMADVVDYLLEEVHPQWAYNLDGGPSSALLYRSKGKKILRTIYGNTSKDADIMAFIELPED